MTDAPWILIADDNKHNREYMRQVFLGRWPVEVVQNGEEALAVLEERIPAVLLLDISMPIVDGWETLRRIRADPRLFPLKVLACTAHSMSGDRERVFAAGFDGYLPKPYRPHELMEFVESFIGPAPQPAGQEEGWGGKDWSLDRA
ncbi:MAG: response regulator [Planctomycetota bacterium]